MSLQDLREEIAEAYYELSDRVPNLPIVLGVIAILLVAGSYFLFFNAPAEQTIAILVKNEAGVAIKDVQVKISGATEKQLITDSEGSVSFTIPSGAEVEVSISKQGYGTQKKKLKAGETKELLFTIKLTEAIATLKEVTINFVSPDGKKVAREVRARLSCSGTARFEQEEYLTRNGELKVTPPEGCGRISIAANADGLRAASEAVLSSEWVVKFAGIDRPKARVQFDVKDSTNEFIDGIQVIVKDSVGTEAGKQETSFGEAIFSLPIDTYTAILSDPGNRYGTKTVQVELNPGETTKKIAVQLSKEVKLRARVKVSEKGGGAVADALVALTTANGAQYDEKKTSSEGTTLFTISEEGTFNYSASKAGYIASKKAAFKTQDHAKGSEKQFDVVLEKCTPSTCGLLKIRVLDENDSPVENAVVTLLDKEGFVAAYGTKTTDFNGYTVQFSGVETGNYYALAHKYPAQGKSELFEVKKTETNAVEMKIIIGTGKVSVASTDASGNAIAFAKADVFTDYGNKVGTIALDADGKGMREGIKADKKVYVIVRKEGYAPYFSSSQQVFKDKSIQFNAQLEQEITGEKPEVKFIGAFSGAAQVQTLQAGKSYALKFLMRVPTKSNFAASRFFFKAGNTESVESDAIWVEGISAAMATVAKGSNYKPPKGETEAATGNAKWVSLEWKEPEGGKYEVEVSVRVREGATRGTELPIFYRSWGVKEGKYLRDPIDRELGEAKENSTKWELYAEAYEKLFLEGMEEACKDSFCFSTRVLNKTTNIYEQAPYKLKTFSPYEMEFTLTNNSQAVLDNAKLSIRNTKDGAQAAREISIDSYEITNASNEKKSSSAPAFEIADVASGNLRQNKNISGTLSLTPKTSTPSGMQFTLVSNQTIAFQNNVPFTVFFQDDIGISVQPENIAAFIPINLVVKAEYSHGEKKGLPLDAANVVVTRISPDRSETTLRGQTDALGNAIIPLPASSPGTKLTIKVEKAGVAARQVEKQIGAEVVAFTPNQVKNSLNRQTREEARARLVAENKIDLGLVVKKIAVAVNSRGLLDEEKMNSFLKQYIGAELQKSGSQKEITVLTALGSEARFLDVPKTLSGKIVAEFSLKENPNTSWVSELPFTAELNLAEMPANAPCIVLSQKEWKDSTVDGRSEIEFEVQNNCVTKEGEAIELKNLQAKVDWKGKDGIVGQVELSITDPSTGNIASEVLQNAVWSRFSEKLEPRVIYVGRLRFVPKPNTIGKKAEFSVNIDAELVTNAGRQFVGASNPINAQIVITNLDQCIEITPHPQEGIKLGRSQTEEEFTVDTRKCGPIGVDIRFCEGGRDNCRGGAGEGGIKVTPWSFTGMREESRTAKVERQSMPGLYGITVETRPEGGFWRKITEIETTIEPEEGEHFTLDKYEFTILGKNSKDSATLTNTMLQESVNVRASICDWEEAADDPGFTGSVAGNVAAGAAIGAAAGFGAALLGASVLAASGIGAIIFVAILIFTVFDDPCDEFETHALQDYVINLAGTAEQDHARYVPPDALDIIMSNNRVKAEWNVDITEAIQKVDRKYRNGKQQVGVVLENLGAEQQEPLYAVATMRAKEHVHGDAVHQTASVNCSGSDFGHFWLNPGTCSPAQDTTYQQKFHLKFKTAEEKASLPKVTFDTAACQSGIDIGRTGKGALPKVKFNWSWKENSGGISANACDASNPDYVYCDATQFTIEVNKKLFRLYEFLEANNFDLGCPLLLEERKQVEEEVRKATLTQNVAANSLGLKETKAAFSEGTLSIVVKVVNSTGTDQNAVVKNTATKLGGFNETCSMDIRNIPAHGEKEGACTISVSESGFYLINSSIESSTSQQTSSAATRVGIHVGEPLPKAQEVCELKTTETTVGVPHILRFLEGKDNTKWTTAVPNAQELEKLLKFDSYLIRDNYSREFFNDFQNYYTTRAFEDTDTYFTSILDDSAGKYGFNRLMERGNFIVKQKYIESSELPGPGKYRAEMAVYFGKDNWRFFNSNGEPLAKVVLVLYKLDDPFPNSPFYYMPFDGLVGLEGDSFRRENYGVAFSNAQNDKIEVSKGVVPLKSYQNSEGLGARQVEARIERGLYSLNASPETRGMLLKVESGTGRKGGITLQPANATPIMMKVTQDNVKQEKFSSYYSIQETENPLVIGNTLTYWDGAGTCLDFTGAPVTEAFYQKPDKRAAPEATQGNSDLRNFYAIEWPMAVKTGEVYLRTIIYTDPKAGYTLKAKQGSPTKFLTADASGEVVPLKGIAGMPYNNAGGGSLSSVQSIEDIFKLTQEGEICVTNNGNVSKFFWNPQKIYDHDGKERNISKATNSLEAGKTCIG